ncbi:MAG: plasmid pRiA4b ORF-3 family protein, partial [Clostridiales bacterium]|nr:plasmid pRiA4b ORF-3 family protein [Clostridiales bacterium]
MAGYTIKITLENTKPPVWRRILIPDAISFSDLHKIIQTAFGWEDMHLHDFRPAGSAFCISPKEAMTAYGREFDEAELTVDDILKSSRWIRYTYDFGDDWRHKIELEKEEPDYRDRHAVIIKAKGDNFAEDCAWDEDGRTGFSQLDANIALAGMNFTRKKPSEKQNMICKLLQGEKELENLYEETRRLQQRLNRLAGIKEQETSGNQRKSKAEQLIRRWELFYAGYENRTEERTSGSDSPEDYEQLSLPGMEVIEKPSSARVTDDVFLLAGSYRVDTTRSEKEVRQLLLNASAGELKDYCRYIGVENSLYSGNKSKTVKAELFTDAMRTYPEFIYYVFSKDEYKWMLRFCFSPAKAIDISEMVSCVGKMIALGFATMSFRMEDGIAVAELETAADLESVLPVEKGRRLDRRYSEIEGADRFIISLLRFLGKAELAYIYETYGDYLEMIPEKADFFRFVYGYYTFPGRAFTGSVSRRQPVIVHPALDLQELTKLCAPYEKRLSYRVFEKWDLDAMSQGITACYPEWEVYDSLLRHDAHLPEYEADDVFGATFAGVLRGWTQDEIRKTFEEHIYGSKRKRLDDCVELWLYSMQLVMET